MADCKAHAFRSAYRHDTGLAEVCFFEQGFYLRRRDRYKYRFNEPLWLVRGRRCSRAFSIGRFLDGYRPFSADPQDGRRHPL